MAWTVPTTFVAGDILTHTQLNNNLNANMNETLVAKATTAGEIFQAGGNNTLNATRIVSNFSDDFFQTTSTSYVNVTGSDFTASVQGRVLILWSASIFTDANFNNRSVLLSPKIDGAPIGGSGSDNWALEKGGNDLTNIGFNFEGSMAIHLAGVGTGTKTFRLQMRSTHGDQVNILWNRMTIIPL